MTDTKIRTKILNDAKSDAEKIIKEAKNAASEILKQAKKRIKPLRNDLFVGVQTEYRPIRN